MKNLQKKIQATESAYDVCTEDLFTQVTQNLIKIQREQSKRFDLARRRGRYLLENPIIFKTMASQSQNSDQTIKLEEMEKKASNAESQVSFHFLLGKELSEPSRPNTDPLRPTLSKHNGSQ